MVSYKGTLVYIKFNAIFLLGNINKIINNSCLNKIDKTICIFVFTLV
jgi:hypothetical protein